LAFSVARTRLRFAGGAASQLSGAAAGGPPSVLSVAINSTIKMTLMEEDFNMDFRRKSCRTLSILKVAFVKL
jgi:hypothetical protein